MKYSKSIISCNAEIIEFIVSNPHPVITSRVIIMDLLAGVRNKDQDMIIVPYGKVFLCLVRRFVTNVWDIHINGVRKVLNKITIIVN